SLWKRCSTPCGINGISTEIGPIVWLTINPCSTPCGINGISTKSAALKREEYKCAQRLAASTESPHALRQRRPYRLRVLPALRHQQKLSPQIHQLSLIVGRSAQRLAASTESPRRRRSPPRSRPRSAQRLAASTESPLESHALAHRALDVLNALRHQ